jgi:hypothetical protein
MAEDRLIELYLLTQNNAAITLQWWLGVTIGVAALGHFVARKLNPGMLILICLLYVSFTYVTMRVLFGLKGLSAGLVEDLENVPASGGVVSTATEYLVQANPASGFPLEQFVMPFMFLGTFLGSLIFLVWSFVQVRKEPKV